jgi:hypothetical protein
MHPVEAINEAAARLEQMERRRLQLDGLDIAQRMIAGDSGAWPRSGSLLQ